MGKVGLEPTWVSPPHFECGASTDFATRPGADIYPTHPKQL